MLANSQFPKHNANSPLKHLLLKSNLLLLPVYSSLGLIIQWIVLYCLNRKNIIHSKKTNLNRRFTKSGINTIYYVIAVTILLITTVTIAITKVYFDLHESFELYQTVY